MKLALLAITVTTSAEAKCAVSLEKDSFGIVTFPKYKFNHHGHRSGYEITGSVFGSLTQRETHYDWNSGQRAFGERWNIGNYHSTKGDVTFYKGGTSCFGTPRETKITWTCGNKLEILEMSEPSRCKYEIKATQNCGAECAPVTPVPPTDPPVDDDVDCSNDNSPKHQLHKFNFRFGKYRNLWLDDDFPHFSDKMQSKLEKLAKKVWKKFRKEGKIDPCAEVDEDEDTTRFDQEDPCRGASQIIGGYRKWTRKYIQDDSFVERLENKFKAVVPKVHGKMNCED